MFSSKEPNTRRPKHPDFINRVVGSFASGVTILWLNRQFPDCPELAIATVAVGAAVAGLTTYSLEVAIVVAVVLATLVVLPIAVLAAVLTLVAAALIALANATKRFFENGVVISVIVAASVIWVLRVTVAAAPPAVWITLGVFAAVLFSLFVAIVVRMVRVAPAMEQMYNDMIESYGASDGM